MPGRSILGSLQLPIAGLGGLLLVLSLSSLVSMPAPPPGSDGFVGGLATPVLYVLAWVGFLGLSLWLSIPVGSGFGIAFTRGHRGLFLLAARAALLSAFGPFVLFGLIYSNPSLMGLAWLVCMGVAVLAFFVAVLWRITNAIQSWRRLDGGPARGH